MPNRTKKMGLWVFVSLTLVYLALSPGSVLSQGYMPENLSATTAVVDNLKYWLTFRSSPSGFRIPHNGFIEIVFELPFVLLSRLFFGPSAKWADRLLSLESVLFTSAICTIVFLWIRRISNSSSWGLILALTAGFTTMLWPYAYINMETTQSFFVLLSGYLALDSDRARRWPGALAFALSCGFAVSSKASGTLFLLPAITFLVLTYFRSQERSKAYWYKTAALFAIVGVMWVLGAFTRPGDFNAGRSTVMFELYGVSPVRYVLNIISFFWSINKGLFVYCPVLLIAMLCMPMCFRHDRRVAVFALLILAGMILGASLVWWWSDEVWGPRYLHCAVAPLIVCMAAANTLLHGKRLRTTAFVTLAFCGLGVSMLGALFEYHSLHWVAILSSPSNIEQFQYDVEWNPIWFDARLMRLWLRGRDAPVSHIDYWPPPDHYVVSLPENLIEYIHPVNIREYAVPQTYLIKTWRNWQDRGDLVWWWLCATSLVLGSGGFAMAASRAGQPGRGEPATETPLSL